MRGLVGVVVFATLMAADSAGADEVVFKNGDRLSGTVTELDAGKLRITGSVACDVVVDFVTVETLTTDAPIEIELNDGSRLTRRARGAEPGTVTTEAGPATVARVIPLSRIRRINPPKARWVASATAGGLVTRGNSETENFNIGIEGSRRTDKDRIGFSGGYYFGRQKNDNGSSETNTDSWFAAGKYDYFVTRRIFPTAGIRIERDRIAELNLRLWPSAGVGIQWFESSDFNLSSEVGLSWVFEDFRNADNAQHIASRLGYHVDRVAGAWLTLFHNFELLPSVEDFSDFDLNLDLGARTRVTSSLFTEFKVIWKFDTNPAPGAERSDQRYIVSLGWKLG